MKIKNLLTATEIKLDDTFEVAISDKPTTFKVIEVVPTADIYSRVKNNNRPTTNLVTARSFTERKMTNTGCQFKSNSPISSMGVFNIKEFYNDED